MLTRPLQNLVNVFHHFHVVSHDRCIRFDGVVAVVDDVDKLTSHPLFKFVDAVICLLLPFGRVPHKKAAECRWQPHRANEISNFVNHGCVFLFLVTSVVL